MGKTAVLFAGQGAQVPGMGRELYELSRSARAVMDHMEDLCPGLLAMTFHGSAEELNQTENTQPCLLAVELAAAAALTDMGLHADGAAGFSLGEVAALVYTGRLLPETAFAYVLRRAAAMKTCADEHPGSMAAILKLDVPTVEALCAQVTEVWPANYNAPAQTVISGASAAVDTVCAMAAERRGRAVKLAVSGAFHSPYMRPATDALRPLLDSLSWQPGDIPLYANVTAGIMGDNAAELTARQVSSPVRWADTIAAMLADGYDTFIELGPGTTLTGLNKKLAPDARLLHVEDAETLRFTTDSVL